MSNKNYPKELSRRPSPKDIIRFLGKVRVNPINGCWRWRGYQDKKGYGQFRVGGKTQWAHRIAFVMFRGVVEEGMVVDHICGHPWCVNPDHLRLATVADNTANGNRTRHGHDPDYQLEEVEYDDIPI